MKLWLCLSFFLFLCAFRGMAQTIVFTPKWTAQAQFAGYYVADKMGYYKEEGLDVQIQHPTIAESSFSFLESGRAQVVVMNLSYALTARAAGARLVNIMQTSQTNSLMLVGRSPIPDVASLQNKKIAVWNHLSQDLLETLARKYGVDVEWIRFNSGVDLYLSGAVDICLVGSYNEYPQLEEFGMKIDSTHLFHLADFGYDLPEDGLYVTEGFYEQHPDLVRKFVNASMRGWKWADAHREETLDMVMQEVRRDNIGTNRYHQRKMLDEILRLQYARGSTEKTFRLDENGFSKAMQCLFPQGMGKTTLLYQDFVK